MRLLLGVVAALALGCGSAAPQPFDPASMTREDALVAFPDYYRIFVAAISCEAAFMLPAEDVDVLSKAMDALMARLEPYPEDFEMTFLQPALDDFAADGPGFCAVEWPKVEGMVQRVRGVAAE